MVTLFLLLDLLVGLSVTEVEGDYEVLVTVHSLVLLESRCAECYGKAGDPIQRDSCCDGNNTSLCPASCDILLGFCWLSDLLQFDLLNRLSGTQCTQSTVWTHAIDLLGNNFEANETHQFSDVGSLGGLFGSLSNPVTYHKVGKWKGAQLNISVTDRDLEQGEFDDLIDHFSIPINISAGFSMASNFTGRYNYAQLELTIEVRCIGVANNTDENCACLPGFTGLLCKDIIYDIGDCVGVMCSDRGRCVDEDNGYRCECFPGFTGQLCEENIDDCIGVTCNNRGQCVDEVQNFSCNCEPGYTGAVCELDIIEITSSSSPVHVAAIIGGVVGGIVISFLLVVLIILLLVFKQKTSSSVQAHNPQEDIDLHEYDYVENETAIETKECAAYAVQKNVDLESNPAYILYAQIADQVTVQMKGCAAYGTQDEVTTEANPAYQQSQCTHNNSNY